MSPKEIGRYPRRRPTKDAIRRQLLVFVEGQETEERYIVHWRRLYRHQVLVTIDDFRGTPLQLVQRAAAAKEADSKNAKRGKGTAFDEVWCVFDIDEHPNVPEAVRLAEQKEISLAISNPCLELWFILHFEDQTGWIDRHRAQRRSETLVGCGKNLTTQALETLVLRHEDAVVRAEQLDSKHLGDGSPANENPSSGVGRLIDVIRLPAD